ncbi:rotatin-like [Diadema antillarum]|uniref:rotatin-like n=1 Tax=Diadema antillarum TaxID=105358 RepID=UPI003A891646
MAGGTGVGAVHGGHEVEEIRARALTNLLSKLEHRLVDESDLVQERHLLIRLLEWFNFKDCPLKQETLSLILRLAAHASAVEHLVKIGAVEFVSQLRYDVGDGLHPLIDDILERLLSLPADMPSVSSQHCLYEMQGANHGQERKNDPSWHASLSPETGRGYFPLNVTLSADGSRSPSRRPLLQDKSSSGGDGIRGVVFSTFPWLPLTATDVHVLRSTNNSLCSPQSHVVLTSCDFITDVVLHDFPAEIFLQRPAIIKSLLLLLADPRQAVADENNVTLRATQCLVSITTLLMARLQFYHDPALYCPKQDFVSPTNSTTSSVGGAQSHSTIQSMLSSDSRPSIIGRNNRRVSGDGRDWDSNSSIGSSPPLPEPATPVPDPETDSDDTIVLQFSQMTLPQFTLEVTEHALNLLKLCSSQLATHLIQMLYQTFRLMRVSMTTDIWQDSSVSGRLLTDKMNECLETLGALIHHHCQSAHEGDGHMTSQQRDHHVRMYQVLTSYTLLYCDHFVPASKSGDILPEVLSSALGVMLLDAGFATSCPEVGERLELYARTTCPEQTRLLGEVQQVASSMCAACHLIREKSSMSLAEKIPCANEACLSWGYHRMKEVIDVLVQACSDICRTHEAAPGGEDVRVQCRQALLCYMAHPDASCRLNTYQACLRITQDCLQVKEAIQPGSEVSYKVTFLVDSKILHEIACYGLDDACAEVQEMSESLLLSLLQGRLLMNPSLWGDLIQALLPVLPLLQARVGVSHPTVGRCVNDLVHKAPGPGAFESYAKLPSSEQVQGALRLLFSKDFRVRTEASTTLMWHLLQEPEAHLKQPPLSPPPMGVADLFIFSSASSLDDDGGTSVFQEEGFLQVFNIFASEDTESDLKKSALQQMAIILQDGRLHKIFISHSGLDMMLETLSSVVMPTGQSGVAREMIPAVFSILGHLVRSSSALRRELAHRPGIYLTLLRVALICRSEEEARRDAALLLTFLIFDESITMTINDQEGTRKMCLPKPIVQNFQLPLRCGITPSVRPHSMAPRPSPDPLRQPETWARLRVEWARACSSNGSNGLDYVLVCKEKRILAAEYNPDLDFTPQETALLAASCPASFLGRSLRTILAATSHFTVRQALWGLSLGIQWTSLQQSRADLDAGRLGSLTRALLSFDWKAALNRFLQVVPANPEDEQLLAQVMTLLTQLLHSPLVTPDLMEWVGSTCFEGHSSLVELLRKYPPTGQIGEGQAEGGGGGGGGGRGKDGTQGQIRKELLRLLTAFIQNLPLSRDAWRRRGAFLGGPLVQALLGSLDLADALHFYDLPSLEATLHCLIHVTARPGWSLDWAEGDSLTLCQQMLTSLQEVVSAFHVGRGGTAMSYMGKGVTKSATLCLLHLTREMAARAVDKNWPSEWLYTSKGASEAGYMWLAPLLSYRDPEVRAAGLGIAASLASSQQGCAAVSNCFQEVPGGVWGLALSVLLDHSECSVVRQQAASVLANLLLQPLASDDVPNGQKPRVLDQDSQMSMSGVTAVLALLQYHRFFPEVAILLSHYYPDHTIRPVSVVEDSTLPSTSTLSGPPTLTTPDTTDNDDVGAARGEPRGSNPSQTERGRPSTEHRSPDGHSLSSSPDTVSPSPSPSAAGRYESVVTPGLVSSVSCLLTNLLAVIPSDAVLSITKENILKTLLRLINVSRIQSLIKEATPSTSLPDPAPSPSSSSSIQSTETAVCHTAGHSSLYTSQLELGRQSAMCSAILRFLLASLQRDVATSLDAAQDGKLAVKCCQLLGLCLPEQADARLSAGLHELWKRSFQLLTALSHAMGVKNLGPVLDPCWRNITGIIVAILRNPSPAATRTAALNFLSVILAKAEEEERKRDERFHDNRDDLQDGEDTKSMATRLLDEESLLNGSKAGSDLCEVLLKAYDGCLPRSTGPGLTREKPAVFSALKILLAVSSTAKQFALDAGLVETTMDSIKQIHTKLTLESLHMTKRSWKKEDPVYGQLMSSFDMLNSMMLHSNNVKIAAHQAGLGLVLHKLWAWLGLDQELMSTTLSLLTTYTAHCPTVCAAIASSSPGQTGNSILHYLMKLTERERSKAEKQGGPSPLLRSLYATLGNVVWFGECRNVLWKSGFLSSFTKVAPPRSSKQTKATSSLNQYAALWLQLFANLTFAMEGQQMVMRIPGSLDLLSDFAQCPAASLHRPALLVLHNLCYLAVNRTRLLSNDKLVRLFLTSLTDGDLKSQFIVTSALYALIYDSQKAKALLKPSRLYLTLKELDGVLQKEIQRPQPPRSPGEAAKRSMAARCQVTTATIMTLLQE